VAAIADATSATGDMRDLGRFRFDVRARSAGTLRRHHYATWTPHTHNLTDALRMAMRAPAVGGTYRGTSFRARGDLT
jgi:hypothetical protein